MSNHTHLVATFALALLLAGGAARGQPEQPVPDPSSPQRPVPQAPPPDASPPDASPLETPAADAPDDPATPADPPAAAPQEDAPPPDAMKAPALGWLSAAAIDKPNDNGTAIMLTWKRHPDLDPMLMFEVMMADDDLFERIDALLELEVIDAGQRASILEQLGATQGRSPVFWPQGRMAAERPKDGRPIAPPAPLKSEFPASFGFAAGNENFHAVEVVKFKRDDLVLYAHPKRDKSLIEQATRRGLVAVVKEKEDLDRPRVAVEHVEVGPRRGARYHFIVHAVRDGQVVGRSEPVSAVPASNWFAWHKMNLMVAMLVLSGIIMSYARIAKRNPEKLFIRRIAGMEAVDDALGRAAEMGKPVFFAHGPGGLTEVVTISALNMLGKIAERVGEFGIEMKVTCLDYLVMQVSQEMVRDGYTRVGRPDAYKDDDVFYVSHNTFAYSAAVSAMMIRENAGTAFFFGRFGSESLLLSETGAITKAIQIAGTDSFNQIPFFITTCDYTLIGEEMYAASAYLSREPRLVGAVKGQDVVKAIFMTVIVTGAVLASFGVMWFARLFWPLTN